MRVWKGAQSFAEGIYVPSDAHPCGWDFIDFSDIECSDDVTEVEIDPNDVSNGYGSEGADVTYNKEVFEEFVVWCKKNSVTYKNKSLCNMTGYKLHIHPELWIEFCKDTGRTPEPNDCLEII